MLAQQKKTKRLGLAMFQYIPDSFKIAQRFGHLFRIYLHKAIMNPVRCKFLAKGCLALRDFILVMGKNQILPSAVNIQRQGQVFLAHGRTLNMPSGTAFSPRAFPERLLRFGRLPQGEIQRIFLFLSGGDTRAGSQVIHIPSGQLAVQGKERTRKYTSPEGVA